MKSVEELNKDGTYHHNDSHTTFTDQQLYCEEGIPQDHEVTESTSDEIKAQKDWPRKCYQMDEQEPYESAMMCWESLDNSEQASKKRKTHVKDEEMNNKADEMDDKMHTKRTTNM